LPVIYSGNYEGKHAVGYNGSNPTLSRVVTDQDPAYIFHAHVFCAYESGGAR